jgi:cysteine desulfurase
MKVYLDNAATSPICEEAIDAMSNLMRDYYGNPSSSHSHGRMVRGVIEMSRKSIAALLKCDPNEICFTSGGTEADNMTLRCSVKEGIKTIITSEVEHKAVLQTAKELYGSGKVNLLFVKLDEKGHIIKEDLERLLSENTDVLVSLMHANNEIGNLIDIQEIGALCKRYGALFHTDTVQTVGHYPIDLSTGNIDFISVSAHKFSGPKGIGLIYVNKKVKFCPMITGGGQERNLRGGTENVLGIVGMAKALEVNCAKMEANTKRITGLKNHLISRLSNEFTDIQFNGDSAGNSNYKVLNVSFPVTDAASMLIFNLDIRGISVTGGSACTSGAAAGSHVLDAIGSDQNRPAVRFSFGKQNTIEELDYVVEQLKELYPNYANATFVS